MASRRNAILEATVRCVARHGVRGLRVEEVAREAGVSLGLIYYHFGDRAGLLGRTLLFVNERAGTYTHLLAQEGLTGSERVERALLLELQDDPLVVENSSAWGELRASAIFEPALREPLRRSTSEWVGDLADVIRDGQRDGELDDQVDPVAAAERLTALVEGLSDRWLSGSLELERARELLRVAVVREFVATSLPTTQS